MKIELIPLTAADPEIHELARIHQSPSVAEYLSLSDHYFDYVTGTEDVVYYKIIADGVLAGGIHCESDGEVLYLSICVREESRRLGIAETALRKLFSSLSGEAGWIKVSIEKTNTPSLALFFKLGFQKTGEAEELLTLRLASKGLQNLRDHSWESCENVCFDRCERVDDLYQAIPEEEKLGNVIIP